VLYGTLWQRSTVNICMKRPTCPACNQRPCAINYYKDTVPYYRSRCETCVRKNRGIKPREPRWKSAGYKKKTTCDRCGFRARYSAQILVYHVDGNLNHVEPKNLRCICRNCEIDIAKGDLVWRPGDLEPDA
jgi:hypothetical protein